MPLDSKNLHAAMRLVHEVCELANDPVEWNTWLIQGLESLIDADGASAVVLKTETEAASLRPTLYLDHNLDEGWSRHLDEIGIADQPITPAVMARMGTDFVATRQELVDDETWNASRFAREVAHKLNWDQLLLSHVFVQSVQMVHAVAFSRRVGRPAFGVGGREVEVVRLVHQELAYLWRRPEAIVVDSLPKRLVETVSGMRRGLGRKEIADELSISPHTVHTYERQLFERFEVSGRGALLARLARVIRPTLPK